MFCLNVGISIYPKWGRLGFAFLLSSTILVMYFTWDTHLVVRYSRYILAIGLTGILNLAGLKHSVDCSDYRNRRIEVLRKRFYVVSRKLMILCPQNIQTDIILGTIQGSYFYSNSGILYADIKGFTAMSSNKAAEDMVGKKLTKLIFSITTVTFHRIRIFFLM